MIVDVGVDADMDSGWIACSVGAVSVPNLVRRDAVWSWLLSLNNRITLIVRMAPRAGWATGAGSARNTVGNVPSSSLGAAIWERERVCRHGIAPLCGVG